MFLSKSRVATVAVVALMVVLFTAPAVQARSFGPAGPSLSAGWLDAALAWVGQLLFGQEQPAPQKATAYTTYIPIDGGGYTPNSGSCIDPEGRPRPCGLGN